MPFMMESAIDPTGDLDMAMYVVLSVIGLCLENMAYTKLYQTSIKWYGRKAAGRIAPGRAQKIFALIWSVLFVLIGLIAVIPLFGGFGVLWTLVAGIFVAVHAWQLFGRGRNQDFAPSPEIQRQMEQLERLRNAGLLTKEEYLEKQRKILEKM